MAFHIRDPETDILVRTLAERKGVGLTEAVKLVVQEALQREKDAVPLWERLQPLLKDIQARPNTGLEADKAFFPLSASHPPWRCLRRRRRS